MEKVNYSTFLDMLTELNSFIVDKYDPHYLLIVRAIGGFSMIIHKRLGAIDSPREESQDIDSLTEDFPDEIVTAIKRIGEKYGATDPDGWLNNHWNRTKNYNEEFSYFIRWQKLQDVSLSNINIYYADLESIFMFKIRAMDDRINLAHREPREQDVIDVVSILRAYKINDFDHVQNDTIKHTIPYFPSAVNYLIDHGIIKGSKKEVSVHKNEKIEETEYGKQLAQKIQTESHSKK